MSEIKRTPKEQFDKQATHYDAEWNTWSQHTLEWMVAAAAPKATDVMLDVATGTGFTARAFAPKVSSVTGTDVSTGMLEQAVRLSNEAGLSNITFTEGLAEQVPFESDTFDIVACRIAAHHFSDIAGFAEESFRVLRPSGRLVIVDTAVPDDDFLAAIWQNDVERLRDPSHNKNYTVNEWTRILIRAGLTVDSISDNGDGIKIPLSSWITKAGCSAETEAEVRRRFETAPQNVRTKFKIESGGDDETWFTWLRVQIKASKPN